MIQTLLGFDYGQRRIGVAVGQTMTGTAEGISTVLANYPIGPWAEIQKLIDAWQPDALGDRVRPRPDPARESDDTLCT